MSTPIPTRSDAPPDEPRDPERDRDDIDDPIDWTLDPEERMPEEAGYGHGV